MRVQPEVLLKLFEVVNQSAEPEIALEVIEEQLTDDDVANLLEIYLEASTEAGSRPGALIQSAIRRLREHAVMSAAPITEDRGQ